MTAYKNAEKLKRQAITAYLRSNTVPRGLQRRIHEYYDFLGGVQRTQKVLLFYGMACSDPSTGWPVGIPLRGGL